MPNSEKIRTLNIIAGRLKEFKKFYLNIVKSFKDIFIHYCNYAIQDIAKV